MPGRQEVERCHDFTVGHPLRQNSASSQNHSDAAASRTFTVAMSLGAVGLRTGPLPTTQVQGLVWERPLMVKTRTGTDGAPWIGRGTA